jgi:AraC family transcriptional regulator, regulatory protein of adaptative response / DNA-3-methyladenine glycosylase II
VHTDVEACLRAVRGRDSRFDGWFFSGVTSTGIYCRPSCPATTPRPEHLRFYPSAAAAQAAGFRACRRCRPDAAPGSPAWDPRADVVARAVRLVADGVVDREGVPGLAGRLGYGTRQLGRLVTAELGAGPLALARAERARTARSLVESTDLPLSDVAHAAGFASVRQFNATVREVYASTPGELRRRARATGPPPDRAPSAPLQLRLAHRLPLEPGNLFGHLAATAVPGVEEWRAGAYRRTLRLPHGTGVVALRPATDRVGDHVAASVRLSDLRDLPAAVARCRRLLDLDADPTAVDDALAEDPALAPLVRAVPGRRVPRSVDAEELAVRAVLGQQVSTAAARTHAARLVAAHGEPVADPDGGLTHLFPAPAALAELDPAALALPAARREALLGLVRALASGELVLDAGADRQRARAELLALPGIGPWTVETVAMRGLGDPDAFLPTDLGVAAAARRLGLPASPGALRAHSARWSPWRAYATQHLWSVLDHPVNSLPRNPPEEP